MRPECNAGLSPDLCSVRDAADILGVSRQRVHRLIQIGAIEAERQGHWWCVVKDSLPGCRFDHGRPLTPAQLARRRETIAYNKQKEKL